MNMSFAFENPEPARPLPIPIQHDHGRQELLFCGPTWIFYYYLTGMTTANYICLQFCLRPRRMLASTGTLTYRPVPVLAISYRLSFFRNVTSTSTAATINLLTRSCRR